MKTSQKIFISKILSLLIKFFKPRHFVTKRNNIFWSIDLNEGLDLYVFIFGKFEYEITKKAKKLNLNSHFKIIDIGANFGIQSLQFAQAFKNSQIFAVEPTTFAFNKFKKNLLLNPKFSQQINLEKYFIAENSKNLPDKIYSSWNVVEDINSDEKHNLHKGVLKETIGAKKIMLDEFVELKKINNVDFIKLDVDGHELSVLKSGKSFLKKKPPIFMELAPYLYRENGYLIDEMLDFIKSLNYKIYNIKSNKEISYEKILKIKFGSSINVLLK